MREERGEEGTRAIYIINWMIFLILTAKKKMKNIQNNIIFQFPHRLNILFYSII